MTPITTDAIRTMSHAIDRANAAAEYPAEADVRALTRTLVAQYPSPLRAAMRDSFLSNSREYWRDVFSRERVAALFDVDPKATDEASPFAVLFASTVAARELERRHAGNLPKPPADPHSLIFEN